jgi:hypothetical protein
VIAMPEDPRLSLDGHPEDTAARWLVNALARYRERYPGLFPEEVRDRAWELVHELMSRDPTLSVGDAILAITTALS